MMFLASIIRPSRDELIQDFPIATIMKSPIHLGRSSQLSCAFIGPVLRGARTFHPARLPCFILFFCPGAARPAPDGGSYITKTCRHPQRDGWTRSASSASGEARPRGCRAAFQFAPVDAA